MRLHLEQAGSNECIDLVSRDGDQSQLPVASGNTETSPADTVLPASSVDSPSLIGLPLFHTAPPPPPPPMPVGGVDAIDAMQASGHETFAADIGQWDNVSTFSAGDDAPAPPTYQPGPADRRERERRLVRDNFGQPLWLPATAPGEPWGYKVLVSDIPAEWELHQAADS